jgi:hypothetical protein
MCTKITSYDVVDLAVGDPAGGNTKCPSVVAGFERAYDEAVALPQVKEVVLVRALRQQFVSAFVGQRRLTKSKRNSGNQDGSKNGVITPNSP